MAGGNQGEEPSGFAQHSPEFAFSVKQLSGHERLSGDLVTLDAWTCLMFLSILELLVT